MSSGEERTEGIRAIGYEALQVGFGVVYQLDGVEVTVEGMIGNFYQETYNGSVTRWAWDGTFRMLDTEIIEEFGLTEEQLFFLNWTTDWFNKFKENPEHETIEEFIQRLKDTCEVFYERAGRSTKSVALT